MERGKLRGTVFARDTCWVFMGLEDSCGFRVVLNGSGAPRIIFPMTRFIFPFFPVFPLIFLFFYCLRGIGSSVSSSIRRWCFFHLIPDVVVPRFFVPQVFGAWSGKKSLWCLSSKHPRSFRWMFRVTGNLPLIRFCIFLLIKPISERRREQMEGGFAVIDLFSLCYESTRKGCNFILF
jgi:hypothetical protein